MDINKYILIGLCVLGALTLVTSLLLLIFMPPRTGLADHVIDIPALKTKLSVSSYSFSLLLVSSILILPYLFFTYKEYGNQEKELSNAKSILESNKSLIKEIQNCTVPINITLEKLEQDSLPDLNNLQVFVNQESVPIYKQPNDEAQNNSYRILVTKTYSEEPIAIRVKELRSEKNSSGKSWKATGIQLYDYITKPLIVTKIN